MLVAPSREILGKKGGNGPRGGEKRGVTGRRVGKGEGCKVGFRKGGKEHGVKGELFARENIFVRYI